MFDVKQSSQTIQPGVKTFGPHEDNCVPPDLVDSANVAQKIPDDDLDAQVEGNLNPEDLKGDNVGGIPKQCQIIEEEKVNKKREQGLL